MSDERQLLEVKATAVRIEDLIYVRDFWWKVLGVCRVMADSGPQMNIWRRGSNGLEEVTAIEEFDLSDDCVIKRRPQ